MDGFQVGCNAFILMGQFGYGHTSGLESHMASLIMGIISERAAEICYKGDELGGQALETVRHS